MKCHLNTMNHAHQEKRTMRQRVLTMGSVILLTLGLFGMTAHAHGNLMITSAEVDFENGLLTLAGYFNPRKDIEVTLDGDTLLIVDADKTQIIADFEPGDVTPGTHRVEVIEIDGDYNEETQTFAVLDVTFGAVGPKGDKGDKGDTGLAGLQGEVGTTGPAGPQGPAGVQGPAGPQGPQGNTGAQGSQGVPGLANHEVVVGSFSDDIIPPGENMDRDVACPSGKVAHGGGGIVQSVPPLSTTGRVAMIVSIPNGTNGWFVRARNVDTVDLNVRVEAWVICATVGS